MEPVVAVEGLSKRYSRNADAHLSYGLTDLFREVFGGRRPPELRSDEFYAVENVSFELRRGDSFALIGRNGSGKTTVLKMMNGITKPDAGRIRMTGRVQALINLGAGFNPALSGRDNVYNSAALMGLDRSKTEEIVNQVVEFAELEDFIDSPVGTYSSGMAARLGFSVSIHLDPDILLIDEILSVGDHAFRNKCFQKLQVLKKRGVTLVLVSHNHTSVVQLCERALWLHKGRPIQLGPAKQIVKAYLDFLEEQAVEGVARANAERAGPRPSVPETAARAASVPEAAQQSRQVDPARRPTPRRARGDAREELYHAMYDMSDRIADLEVDFLVDAAEAHVLRLHDELVIQYRFWIREPIDDLNVSLVFYRKDGLQLTAISTLNGDLLKDVHLGRVHCTVRIPDFHFNPGEYVLVMPIHEGKSYLYRGIVKEFVVKGWGLLAWAVSDLRYEYKVES